ncbi:hypothetical protein FNV43_RR22443 [Rhamnella rubrinervis]|uniref:Tf2-1-like SH3-like domain-containing protein n=1 Tax=Rhamnella rubrinervis TaxID=2594499 RepID=A0A8K0GR41_9ROSA|nr:hypothetical protein FNV43_RR22443 [Rhamnella rubrinervis]
MPSPIVILSSPAFNAMYFWILVNRICVSEFDGKGKIGMIEHVLLMSGAEEEEERRYERPFSIIKKVGRISCKVELPSTRKLIPVFHISCLKPYHRNKEDPSRGKSKRTPMGITTTYDKEVESITAERMVREMDNHSSHEYLVK